MQVTSKGRVQRARFPKGFFSPDSDPPNEKMNPSSSNFEAILQCTLRGASYKAIFSLFLRQRGNGVSNSRAESDDDEPPKSLRVLAGLERHIHLFAKNAFSKKFLCGKPPALDLGA